MNLRELIVLFRQEVDDLQAPHLWSRAEAIDYANDALQEACRRARLLIDSATAGIAQQPIVVADNGLVMLDKRVLFVRRARLAGGMPLHRKTMQDMEDDNPWWEDTAPGIPRVFITDYATDAIKLYPPPAMDSTLHMTVIREPLAEMNDDQDEPEIANRWQRSLRHWMVFRAYAKQDSEAADPKKAATALALFEQEFGAKSSAQDEAWIAREQVEHDGTY